MMFDPNDSGTVCPRCGEKGVIAFARDRRVASWGVCMDDGVRWVLQAAINDDGVPAESTEEERYLMTMIGDLVDVSDDVTRRQREGAIG